MFRKLKEKIMTFFGYSVHVEISNNTSKRVWRRRYQINWRDVKRFIIHKLKIKRGGYFRLLVDRQPPKSGIKYINGTATYYKFYIPEELIKRTINGTRQTRFNKIGTVDRISGATKWNAYLDLQDRKNTK